MNASDSEAALRRFGETIARLDAEIDWDVCAAGYCEGDATGFFEPERREAILDAGLRLGADVGSALEERARRGGPQVSEGRSLYIGAAVAELAPMLFESIVLRRRVTWVALPTAEMTELTRALEVVDPALPRPRTSFPAGRWLAKDIGPCDHIWMTSVLTDPEAFPALHNELYGRRGTKEAVRGGHPKAERARAHELTAEAIATVRRTALLTTTDEELTIWRATVAEVRGTLDESPTGRTNGLVGDVVRISELRLH